jgi:hypothetical protein
MNELKELVDEAAAARIVWAIALAVAFGSLVVGAAAGLARGALRPSLLRGVLVALLGPLVMALWWVYNAVIGKFGLDSVKGLLINMAMFLAVGAIVGIAGKRLWNRLGAA